MIYSKFQAGVESFLSNNICQDPLEKFFGQQRQRGGAHENPNVAEFIKNTQALRVINSTCAGIKGNCRGSNNNKRKLFPIEKENAIPLTKRRRQH